MLHAARRRRFDRALALVALAACGGEAAPQSSGKATGAGQEPAPPGMVWVPGGEFTMGGDDVFSRADEKPLHRVRVSGFFMDATEVTVAQFRAFVDATGYVTTAEKPVDWEELRKQLPEGTPKPDDAMLSPGSLVFVAPSSPVELSDASRWWVWTPGASWRHPLGPDSTARDDEPVVQVSWDDAVAYATWAGKRLPTEAEWEFAARGGAGRAVHPWGDEPPESGAPKANTWQGHFPDRNTARDGFAGVAPVRSFAPNGYGLFDMAGNVWEWCSDWYRPDTYARDARSEVAVDPSGPASSFDPQEPTVPKRVQRGGSFLCHDSYCASYRCAARMKTSPDTALSHAGFRCVVSVPDRR